MADPNVLLIDFSEISIVEETRIVNFDDEDDDDDDKSLKLNGNFELLNSNNNANSDGNHNINDNKIIKVSLYLF